MRLTYEAMLADPNLIEIAHANARRERATAVRELIVLPIKRFFTEPAARPQLARQGKPALRMRGCSSQTS